MKKIIVTHVIVFFFITLFFVCNISQATGTEAIATVVAIRGEVKAVDASGQSRKLLIKDTLNQEDTVSTNKSSRIQILFRDSTIISLGRKTEMKLAEYDWNPEKKTGALKTKVTEGTFRIMGGAITRFTPQNFSTETPTATIGVRGSMYAGTVTPDSLSVLFQGGKGIDITNPAGTVAITRPGFGTHVHGIHQPPLPPLKFSREDLAAINGELTGEIEDQQNTTIHQENQDGSTQSDDSENAAEKNEDQPPPDGDAPPPKDENTNSQKGNTPPDGDKPPEDQSPVNDDTNPPSNGDPSQPEGKQPPPADGQQPHPKTNEPLPPDRLQPHPDENKPLPPDRQQPSTGGDQLPPPPNGVMAPPSNKVAPPIGSNMPFTPDGAMSRTDGRISPPPENNYTFMPEGDLAFMPEGDVLVMTGQIMYPSDGMPPPPDGGTNPDGTQPLPPNNPTYLEGSMQPPKGGVYPPRTKPPPPDDSHDYDPMFHESIVAFNPDYIPPDAGDFYDPALIDIPLKNPLTMDPTPTDPKLLTGDPNVIPANMPNDGLSEFIGNFSGVGTSGRLSGKLFMEVNWHAGKAFGLLQETTYDPEPPAFFYGTVNGTSLNNVRVIGGSDGHSTLASDPSLSNGVFRGANYELFNSTTIGSDWNISIDPSSVTESWDINATTQRLIDDPLDHTVPGGTVNWTGFAVGISENVNDIFSDRKRLMNTSDSNFTVTIDRDAGTLDGALTVDELAGGDGGQFKLAVGGTNGSAYIFDDSVIAELGCLSTCISVGGGGADLNPEGNYLISEDPMNQPSQYMTWGYWEVSHHEPDGSDTDGLEDMFHTHVPYSMWIAGAKTPSTYVAGLIGTGTAATYNGFAHASKTYTSAGNEYVTKVDGTVNLVFTFTATPTLSGNIALPGQTLNLVTTPGTSVTSNGFVTTGTGFSEATSGSLNGNFYGPQINAVGGNFNATVGTDKYLGIFGANKQ